MVVGRAERLTESLELVVLVEQHSLERFCFGMWWRRAALALNGMTGFGVIQGLPSCPSSPHGTNR
jgi:hypothetical protein